MRHTPLQLSTEPGLRIAAGMVSVLTVLPATTLGQAATEPEVTFSRDVAPLLQEHCQVCHRPGSIGPMSLLTYRISPTTDSRAIWPSSPTERR
jgi:hypothetical protein